MGISKYMDFCIYGKMAKIADHHFWGLRVLSNMVVLKTTLF